MSVSIVYLCEIFLVFYDVVEPDSLPSRHLVHPHKSRYKANPKEIRLFVAEFNEMIHVSKRHSTRVVARIKRSMFDILIC